MTMKNFNCFLLILLFPVLIFSQDKVKSANELIDKYCELEMFNGSILVSEGNSILLERTFGYADYKEGQQLNINTTFELASVSKAFTAMGILILVDKGMLSLDDSLRNFFPQLTYSNITIRNMLTHTSGLPDYIQLFEEKWDHKKVAANNDIIQMLSVHKPPIEFLSGQKWNYSNTGYALLASIIEKVSDKKYSDFLKENIFVPLEMNSTSICTAQSQSIAKNQAKGHIKEPMFANKMQLVSDLKKYDLVYYLGGIVGDGAVNSNVKDLLKWDEAFINGKLISKELMAEALTPVILNDGKNTETDYGFGWVIKKNITDETEIYHDGGWPGFITRNYINLDKKRVLIVLSNSFSSKNNLIAEGLKNIFEGQKYNLPKKSFAITAGKYLNENGSKDFTEYVDRIIKSNDYSVSEMEINLLGYQFLGLEKNAEAIESFKLNVELFPNSWNVYDSLGEAYMKSDENEQAIKNYQKSIELNSDNENGKKQLQQLLFK